MKLAFVYAGQGSQKVGMGQDFYQAHPTFQKVLDSAPVDFDLKKLCLEGPEEQLGQTRYTQPCLVAFAIGVTNLLAERGVRPDAVAGLSLGEYSALYAAGVLDGDTALKMVAFRGRAMEDAAAGQDCGMTAVLSLDEEKLQQACDGAAELGVVQICNYNCPGQLVIGGTRVAVDRAGELAKELGAKRCMPLKVSGPFHTKLMKGAGDALADYFKDCSFGQMQVPVYFNCKGGPMDGEDTIPALLERQVQSPVYWQNTILAMQAAGIDTILEIGPGKALTSFVKKTAPGIVTYNIDTAADLESVVAALKGEGL